MRVLTVRQPWAWAIIHGGKDVENRVRSLGPYRGPVAIHAGLGWDDERGATDPNVLGAIIAASPHDAPIVEANGYVEQVDPEFEIGAVIGVVNLTGTHEGPNTARDRMRAVRSCYMPGKPFGLCSPWAMPDHHHLVLEDPRPLARPIPAKGRLGLWRPDTDLETEIRDQLERGGA